MTPAPNEVSVWVQDKEFRVACADDEVELARAAATLLNRQLEEVCAEERFRSQEQPLLLAAMALAGDLESCRRDGAQLRGRFKKHLDRLRDKVAAALDERR